MTPVILSPACKGQAFNTGSWGVLTWAWGGGSCSATPSLSLFLTHPGGRGVSEQLAGVGPVNPSASPSVPPPSQLPCPSEASVYEGKTSGGEGDRLPVPRTSAVQTLGVDSQAASASKEQAAADELALVTSWTSERSPRLFGRPPSSALPFPPLAERGEADEGPPAVHGAAGRALEGQHSWQGLCHSGPWQRWAPRLRPGSFLALCRLACQATG